MCFERSATDPSYLEGKRLVVTPSVNPDGYFIDCRNNWNSVDLNRNYPYMWECMELAILEDHVTASGTYRGPSEGSEIETQINMELMRNMNLYISQRILVQMILFYRGKLLVNLRFQLLTGNCTNIS